MPRLSRGTPEPLGKAVRCTQRYQGKRRLITVRGSAVELRREEQEWIDTLLVESRSI
jgi:hypothetical protein